MRGYQRIVFAFAIAAILVAVGRGSYRPRPSGAAVLVPAYFYPGKEGLADWDRMAEAAGQVSLRVVLNPASGPGLEADPNYVDVVRKLRRAGATILGYVHTTYGVRDPEAVKADLDAYRDFYGVDGYFLDEMGSRPGDADYYARLRDLIKGRDRGLEIVGNPGVVVPESFVSRRLADVFILFEGPASRFAIHQSPRWIRNHPRARFGAIVHGAAAGPEMERLVDVAAANHLGVLFISDGAGANPYARLPGYWSQELAAIGRLAPANGPADPDGSSR